MYNKWNKNTVWKPSHTFNSYTDSVLVYHSIYCTTIKQISSVFSIYSPDTWVEKMFSLPHSVEDVLVVMRKCWYHD